MTHESPHVCTADTCPNDGAYYVSAIDGPSYWLMSGPYVTHAAALADVDKALRIASEREGKAWFMSWGTCHMKAEDRKPGVLQKFGLLSITQN